MPRHPQLDDVALWWSIAASYFGWAADPSQFLDTPQSRQFTVHEFVRIQWQLHNSPLPEQSTYAIPTPQLIERVSHALEQLKKLSEAALRENNIPLGKSLSRANSERPLFAGGLHEFRPSNGQIEQRHGYGVAVLPTVDPASEMDVDHDPVASTSPAPIPFNPEAKARPSPVHTRASPTAQDPIPLVDSSPVENIAPQDTSDPPSAGQSKKRRGGAGRTKSKTKLRVKMEQNPEKLRQSARINVTSRLKLGVEGGKHLASPTTLTPPPTRKRKGKDHDRITPGPDNAADDTSEAPPEKPAVDSLERPISNTPATVRRKRGRPKKTLILDPIVVSSPPESNEIQESRCVSSFFSYGVLSITPTVLLASAALEARRPCIKALCQFQTMHLSMHPLTLCHQERGARVGSSYREYFLTILRPLRPILQDVPRFPDPLTRHKRNWCQMVF